MKAIGKSISVVALSECARLINLLLTNDAIKANSDQAAKNGATPLFIATEKGHFGVVNALILNKATVDAGTSCGVDILFEIADKLNRKTKVEDLFKNKNTLSEIPSEITALTIAVLFGHDEIVNLLLRSGADINRKAWGISLLDIARAMNHQGVAALLANEALKMSEKTTLNPFTFFQPIHGPLDASKTLTDFNKPQLTG